MTRKRNARKNDAETPWNERFMFKYGSRLLLGITVIVVFLTLAQCTVEKPESPQWSTRLTVPIVNRTYDMEELVNKIATISPGQRVVYVTDIIGSPENFEKVVHLARGADHLYIEAAFLDEDRETAHHKYHLTAKEAGEMARRAEVKAFTPFHFSPRYRNREAEIGEEAQEAFRGEG